MIIGLCGPARSGKDEAARPLIARGFRRIAFADPLKRGCREMFGLTDQQLWGADKDAVDEFWGCTPRHILQQVGTECMRQGFRDDIWIKAFERQIRGGGDWVVTDVRFPNEGLAIQMLGGVVWSIDRPDGPTIKTTAHTSETSISRVKHDAVLRNHGTIEDLHRCVISQFVNYGRKDDAICQLNDRAALSILRRPRTDKSSSFAKTMGSKSTSGSRP